MKERRGKRRLKRALASDLGSGWSLIIDGVIGFLLGCVVAIAVPDIALVASALVGVAYVVGFWIEADATPGKMVMGLKIVDAETGGPLSPGKAFLRYFGYIVSSIPFLLGFFWVLWDPKNQAWHDKIASTRVVKAK